MQCILTSFNCCYSNGTEVLDPFQFLTKTSISSHIFADFVILMLQVFWTASLHLEYIFTFSKLIPHEP